MTVADLISVAAPTLLLRMARFHTNVRVEIVGQIGWNMTIPDSTPNFNMWIIDKSTSLKNDHSYDFIYTDALWWEDTWPAKKWSKLTRRVPYVGPAEVLSAIVVWHKKLYTDEICGALIHFVKPITESEKALDYPIYRVESLEPLEIMEMIICKQCGDKGFIKNGKWEPI